jgi:prepilin-type N-terminal cleavage/methylation domain-containing protein
MQSRSSMMLFRDKRGFTLTELIVVMAIFLTVIMITATAFKTIVNSSSQQSKSVETQIEGIVGLEVLRADLEHAGFGLPWIFQTTSPSVTYDESLDDSTAPASFWPAGQSPASFNDAPGNAPRAILSGSTIFNKDAANIGSNYLVIKSTMAVASDTSKKWTTVAFDKDGVKGIRQWNATDRDFTSDERVIVVKNSLMTTPPTRQLMASASTVFSATFGTYSTLTIPHQNGDTFEIYGVNPNTDLRMPFNRADYYVRRLAKMPKSCMESPGVGILYKSTVIQGSGGLTPGMPLLDCVADMQVVYGLDNDGTGRVNQYLDAPANTVTPSAADIRNQLREIRVYILAQEGGRDVLFTNPSETVMVGEVLNGIQRGRVFNLKDRLGPDYKYYRWKVYTIVVRPKNLVQ